MQLPLFEPNPKLYEFFIDPRIPDRALKLFEIFSIRVQSGEIFGNLRLTFDIIFRFDEKDDHLENLI